MTLRQEENTGNLNRKYYVALWSTALGKAVDKHGKEYKNTFYVQ
jgi:hypothetical protein